MQNPHLSALVKGIIAKTTAEDPLNILAMAVLHLDDQRAADQIALKRTIVELERKVEKAGQVE
jgi:hypothetical protein